ncbi:hypothetical protein ANANG_G00180460 [Anguilla anguilla]|uniref:Uncharacterized protein n=1 Tax=Anguilla anguilla TaxID=7936 RepID=A0A9D3M8C1_ANGAN|nr:hypothetical protein ANANG_G00180460 [Anguilla anguilla]
MPWAFKSWHTIHTAHTPAEPSTPAESITPAELSTPAESTTPAELSTPAESTPAEYTTLAEPSPQGLESTERLMMVHLRAAALWYQDHQHLFSDPVHLPRVLAMEEREVAEVLRRYTTLCEIREGEGAQEETLAPFFFFFENKEDMEVFLRDVVDRLNYTVFCLVPCEPEEETLYYL